jgi:hypothetical protein
MANRTTGTASLSAYVHFFIVASHTRCQQCDGMRVGDLIPCPTAVLRTSQPRIALLDESGNGEGAVAGQFTLAQGHEYKAPATTTDTDS